MLGVLAVLWAEGGVFADHGDGQQVVLGQAGVSEGNLGKERNTVVVGFPHGFVVQVDEHHGWIVLSVITGRGTIGAFVVDQAAVAAGAQAAGSWGFLFGLSGAGCLAWHPDGGNRIRKLRRGSRAEVQVALRMESGFLVHDGCGAKGSALNDQR